MEINDWRERIDEINDELIALLNRRAHYATEIGKIKKQRGLPVFDGTREKAVLEGVARIAESHLERGGVLSSESVKRIFQVIMEETRKVEE